MSRADWSLAWSGNRSDAAVPHFEWLSNPLNQDVARLVLDPELVPDRLRLEALTFAQAMEAEIAAASGADECVPLPPDYPSIASVHAVLRTSDGYFICSLRRPHARYQASRWSVSFEEQVKGGHDFDKSPADTAMRGLAEEFSPVLVDLVRSVALTAIGREMYSEQDSSRQVRSTFMVVDVALIAPLDELAEVLNTGPLGMDLHENTTWLALRPRLASDWLTSNSPSEVAQLGGDLRLLRGEGGGLSHPWHATSLARLELSGHCV